jgi:hypothetical protein
MTTAVLMVNAGVFQATDIQQGENTPMPSSKIVSQTRIGLLIN